VGVVGGFPRIAGRGDVLFGCFPLCLFDPEIFPLLFVHQLLLLKLTAVLVFMVAGLLIVFL
jgi:hypothetical protein